MAHFQMISASAAESKEAEDLRVPDQDLVYAQSSCEVD